VVVVDGLQHEGRVAQLPTLPGDTALLRQVWTNFLSNAAKYSAGATPRPVVEVSARTDEAANEVIFAVRDNGVGFDPRYADKLFQVFSRLHDAQQFEGTGIGLALVRRIVSRHGGRTWAESQPGKGATFHFSLPIKPSRRNVS
jgi:signal transduction histidine kinase